jgi:uncharacterized protein YeaO (DUF488 family)
MSPRGVAAGQVRLRRVYDPPSNEDGLRVLVDRLWPRGLSKAAAAVDRWMKDVAPSTELRRWFSHDPDRWLEFRRRYTAELQHQPAVEELRELSRHNRVTLLFGARDTERNDAVVLRDVLLQG